MGYSRQDYGDCGAASPGNSCYKTHAPGTRAHTHRASALRWEEIRPYAFMGNKIARACVCVSETIPPLLLFFLIIMAEGQSEWAILCLFDFVPSPVEK